MGNCETCKYWNAPEDERARWGKCFHILEDNSLVEIYGVDEHGRCTEAVAETLPTFSCGLWKAAE